MQTTADQGHAATLSFEQMETAPVGSLQLSDRLRIEYGVPELSSELSRMAYRSLRPMRAQESLYAMRTQGNVSMSIGQRDIKLLWGRSGNRCAICRRELTQDKAALTSAFTLGEQAHIVGEKPDAPRGKSPLSQPERDSYHNLILLCPNDHAIIDKNEADWPVEKLHQVKSEHELWVTETLSETVDHVKLAQDTILASVVDCAVALCFLDRWQSWTSYALSTDPQWPKELLDNIYTFRQKVIAAIWPPHHKDFRNATITFSVLIHRASAVFREHSERQGEVFLASKFYKRADRNPDYAEDLRRYEEWKDRCYSSLYDATKAANWFADVVRAHVNPMFFAEEGKFLVTEGPLEDLSWRTTLLEFTEEEKAAYPDKALNV